MLKEMHIYIYTAENSESKYTQKGGNDLKTNSITQYARGVPGFMRTEFSWSVLSSEGVLSPHRRYLTMTEDTADFQPEEEEVPASRG